MAAGEQARAAEDAWAGLAGYLQAVFGVLAADRGTNDLMTTHLEGVESLCEVHTHNRETLELLLRRGREQGTVRADVGTDDVLFALAALGRTVPAPTRGLAGLGTPPCAAEVRGPGRLIVVPGELPNTRPLGLS